MKLEFIIFLHLLVGLASLFAACGSCAAVACLEAAALHCLSRGLHLPKFSYFLFAFIYLSDCGCMRKMRNSVDWNFSVSTFFFFFVPVMNFIICFPSFEEKLAYWNHVLFTFRFSGNVTFCMKKKKGRKISKISLHYRPEKKTKNRDKISFIVWWQKFDHLHNSKKNSNLTKKWSMSQFWFLKMNL